MMTMTMMTMTTTIMRSNQVIVFVHDDHHHELKQTKTLNFLRVNDDHDKPPYPPCIEHPLYNYFLPILHRGDRHHHHQVMGYALSGTQNGCVA